MNSEWALEQLTSFLRLVDYREKPGLYAASYVGSDDEIITQLAVVERIWERVIGPLPVGPRAGNDPWRSSRDWALRCKVAIEREREIVQNLGDDAPELSASSMHRGSGKGHGRFGGARITARR